VHHGKLMHFVPENGTYAWFRYDADSTVMVVINKNTTETEIDLARFQEVLKTPATARDVIAGKSVKLGPTLKLTPRSVRILEVR
jgi:neopullulanase